jgi:hypothetical protein
LTWTQLGLQLDAILSTCDLPETDRFLTRHLLGFIKSHLWQPEEAQVTTIELDDVYLMRAFGALGRECERKIDRLVEPLAAVLSASVPSGGAEPRPQQSLFKGTGRSVVYARLRADSWAPTVFAGVVLAGPGGAGVSVCVWIETSPTRADAKKAVRESVKEHIERLKSLDQRWSAETDLEWWDIMMAVPMKHILVEEDQDAWMSGFVSKALRDLDASGLLKRLATFELP